MENKLETYSIPIYVNGIKIEYTIDGIVGDDTYKQLMEKVPAGCPQGVLPNMINVNVNQDEKIRNMSPLR
jgi:hypothetical protein